MGNHDFHEDVDHCARSDARCVGHAILDALGAKPGTSGVPKATLLIKFYGNYGCNSSHLLLQAKFIKDGGMRNIEICNTLSKTFGTSNVYSYKNGTCPRINNGVKFKKLCEGLALGL